MMTQEPRTFHIGQLAAAAGVNPKTIRFYEEKGLLLPPARTASGYRIYTAHDLDRLQFIQQAKAVGFSLDAIGQILTFRDQSQAAACQHVRTLLDEKVAGIRAQLTALTRMEQELSQLRRRAEHILPCDDCYCPILEGRSQGVPKCP